ncbi:hypothetical protein FACS1894216_18640 [Synergistales bacterium]|nr:hypothetical protein FACS1894216_18640 [Synergistales bacterium]
MDLLRFNADDIHELRVQMGERYRSIPKEDAEREYQREVEEVHRAIEEIRQANAYTNH